MKTLMFMCFALMLTACNAGVRHYSKGPDASGYGKDLVIFYVETEPCADAQKCSEARK